MLIFDHAYHMDSVQESHVWWVQNIGIRIRIRIRISICISVSIANRYLQNHSRCRCCISLSICWAYSTERERVDFSNFCCSSLSVRVVTPAAPSQSRAKRRIVPQPETQVSSISIQRCFRFSDLVFSEFRSFRSVDSVSLVAIRSCVVH